MVMSGKGSGWRGRLVVSTFSDIESLSFREAH